MSSSTPLIRVRDLSLTHAGADDPACRDVGFELHPGEVVLLLGPSGSGKSTLTLALNGLIPHSIPARREGTVEVSGRDTAQATVAELSTTVSMVFQDPDAQLVTGSVLDEVCFAPENLLLPVEEVLARAETALRRMGLWERRAENPDRLSGGGRQRLAIACALATGSPVIVLDEPTANLDPEGADDVYDALAKIAVDGDRAILLVEHDLDRAVRIATRVLVLDGAGQLRFDGGPEQVLRNRAEDLRGLGVWLPTATLAALRLRERGVPVDPLPLTPQELTAALRAAPVPPTPVSGVPGTVSEPAGSSEPPTKGISPRPAPPRTETPPAAETIVRVRGLTVTRRRTTILHDVNLDIAQGSITAVVGTNGAGKTTLVQAIAGVNPPPRGCVRIAGLDPATTPSRELTAHVGFVFQNPEHQFVTATVADELGHGLHLRRVPAEEIHARVAEMLARFGLEHKADVHPFLLSGGEKRRLSVGTALITRPRVLVLDEPTFGQDRARASELLALLHDLRREGTTIVIVSHDMHLVAEHATHVTVVGAGRVVASGAAPEVLGTVIPLPATLLAVPERLRPLLRQEDA